MRFDRFDADAFAAKALLPDGQHEVQITKVKEVITKADGKAKTIITMEPSSGEYAAIERWLDPADKGHVRMALQLLAALGMPADSEVDSSLVGRRVTVTTRAGTKRSGEAAVFVNDFSSCEADFERDAGNAAKAEKPARKTPAAKATGPDDIPF